MHIRLNHGITDTRREFLYKTIFLASHVSFIANVVEIVELGRKIGKMKVMSLKVKKNSHFS